MINVKRVVKAGVAWMSVLYVVCFAGVALFPGIREGFMLWGLHMNVGMGTSVTTSTTFISGLVIWDVFTAAALWLFAVLYNGIKE